MKNLKKSNLTILLNQLTTLDLDAIKFKLMDPEEGEGWTREQADAVDLMYRRFLFLNIKFPDETIVPNKLIDKFWHAHILDTQKYMDDCQTLFGEYLHHFPYLGMRGEDDARLLADSFETTLSLFSHEFGVGLAATGDRSVEATKCSSACNSTSNCWGGAGCSGGKCNVKKANNIRPRLPVSTGRVTLYSEILNAN